MDNSDLLRFLNGTHIATTCVSDKQLLGRVISTTAIVKIAFF